MFKRALVGVDLSPAEESLLSCLPDVSHLGIESRVLAHVIRIGYAQGAGDGYEDEYRAWLEKAATPIREAGLTVTTSVTASGVPAEELLAGRPGHKVRTLSWSAPAATTFSIRFSSGASPRRSSAVQDSGPDRAPGRRHGR
jgi:hypothetical protein